MNELYSKNEKEEIGRPVCRAISIIVWVLILVGMVASLFPPVSASDPVGSVNDVYYNQTWQPAYSTTICNYFGLQNRQSDPQVGYIQPHFTGNGTVITSLMFPGSVSILQPFGTFPPWIWSGPATQTNTSTNGAFSQGPTGDLMSAGWIAVSPYSFYEYGYCKYANGTTYDPLGIVWNFHRSSPPVIATPAYTTNIGTYISTNNTVSLIDTSSVSNGENISSWNWSFGDGNSATVKNPVHLFPGVGDYNVSLGVTSVSNSTKVTVYHTISIINPIGNVSLWVDIRDGSTSALITNANEGIQNVTSGVWRNGTSPSGKIYFDATGASWEYPIVAGQTVKVAASKDGYQETSQNVSVPYDHYLVTLNLLPLNMAPSMGNISAIIAVSSLINGTAIPGASVNIQTQPPMAVNTFFTMTNDAGAASFYNVPAGNYNLQASATGYQPVSDNLTGTSGQTVMKAVQLLPNGYTVGKNANILDPSGNVVSGTGLPAGTGAPSASNNYGYDNSTANGKAAGGVLSFLDNLVPYGKLILLLLLVWFASKIV